MSALALDQLRRASASRFLQRGPFPIKTKGPITALDWDERILRVAQASSRGPHLELERLTIEPLDYEFDVAKSDPAAAGTCLAEALKRLKLKPGPIVMGIPRSLVFLRALALPRAETAEALVSMVYFQISRDLPFRLEDAVVDFQVNTPPAPANPTPPAQPPAGTAPTTPAPPKVQVLVAVAKREVVQFYERVAAAAGLKLAALGFQSYANARALKACWPAESQSAVALVSLRRREVIIDVIADGLLLFSRTASLAAAADQEELAAAPLQTPNLDAQPASAADAAPTPTDDARLVELILIEVVRSLHNYTGANSQHPVEAILVAGESDQADAIADALGERCKLPSRRLASLPLGAPALAPKTGRHVADALTTVGLALSAHDQTAWPFNFLQPKRPPAPRAWGRSSWLALAAALLALVLGAGAVRAALCHGRLKTKGQLLAQLDQANKNSRLYSDKISRARGVHGWVAEKREWLDHWAALSLLLPDSSQVYVTSIAAGSRGVLHVSLQARNGEILAQVDKRLREAGYELRPLAVTPSSDRYGYSFQTSLELTLPSKLKQDWRTLPAPARPADDASLERKR